MSSFRGSIPYDLGATMNAMDELEQLLRETDPDRMLARWQREDDERLKRALNLATDLETFEALLCGEKPPLSKLDQVWVPPLHTQVRRMSEPRYGLEDFHTIPGHTIDQNGRATERDSWLPLILTALPAKPPIKPTLGQLHPDIGLVYPGIARLLAHPNRAKPSSPTCS